MKLKPRDQGHLGELSAIEWLGLVGALVCVPIGHSPDFDLMAELDGRPIRVQVKTGTHFRNGRWEVHLATRGGNQSWNRVAKLFGSTRCDYLFALVGDGRRWFIPSDQIEARHALQLGGPKYAEYEVDRGRPILASAVA